MIAIRKFPEGRTLLFSFRPLCLRRRDPSETLVAWWRRAVGRKSSSQRSKRIGAEDVRFVASKKATRIEKKAYFPRVPPLSTACHRRRPFFAFLFRWIHPRVWKRHTPSDVREKNLKRGNSESSSWEWITFSMVQSSFLPDAHRDIILLTY